MLGNRIADALESACGQIASFPQSGRLGRVEGTREVVLSTAPYIAAYKVDAARTIILAIIHEQRAAGWKGILASPEDNPPLPKPAAVSFAM